MPDGGKWMGRNGGHMTNIGGGVRVRVNRSERLAEGLQFESVLTSHLTAGTRSPGLRSKGGGKGEVGG